MLSCQVTSAKHRRFEASIDDKVIGVPSVEEEGNDQLAWDAIAYPGNERHHLPYATAADAYHRGLRDHHLLCNLGPAHGSAAAHP